MDSNKNLETLKSDFNCRVYGHQTLVSRGQPVGGTSPSSSTSSLGTTSSSSSSSNLPRPTYNIPKANNVNGNQLQYQHQKTSQKIAKPISSVAPTNIVQKSSRSYIPTGEKPSPIYQTSSTKILPVQPQTLGSTPQVRFSNFRQEILGIKSEFNLIFFYSRVY